MDPYIGISAGAHLLRLRSKQLHWRRFDGEVIALEGRSSRYLSTTGSGAVLWQALAEGGTRESLADQLVAIYGIDRDRALADVERYIAELDARGLLEP